MAETTKIASADKEVSQVSAKVRGLHISPRKVRLVADLVKGKQVDEALTTMTFLNKKAAKSVKKLIDSGIANAKHNFNLDTEKLYIKTLTVDGGPVLMTFSPRAQGRAFPKRKRTSHLILTLGILKNAPKKLIKAARPAVVAETKEKFEEQGGPAALDTEKKETK